MCGRGQSLGSLQYEPYFESNSGDDRVPQSARFYLTTHLAYPPETSIQVWLIVVLSIGGLGAFCVCATMIASWSLKRLIRSLQEEQVSGLGEGGLNSACVLPAFHSVKFRITRTRTSEWP